MNSDSCPKSEAVVQAVHSGNWPEGLQAHVEACESCRETRLVASWMMRMAKGLESIPGELPDPELIRLKAKIGRRSQLPARALLPLKAGGLFGAAGLGLLFTTIPESAWHRIREWQAGEIVFARLRDWQLDEAALIRLFDSLPAALATGWWIPFAAILLFLLVFTTSEA